MKIKEIVEGIPFYVCETPTVKYRESWQSHILEEIETDLPKYFSEPLLLRGVTCTQDNYKPGLEQLAKIGADGYRPKQGETIYVTDDLGYAFSRAKTGLLLYKASGLREIQGDAEAMNREFNRYFFLIPPNEALQGVIDLREVTRISKRLRSLDRMMMRRSSG